jgi:hypothetical protein
VRRFHLTHPRVLFSRYRHRTIVSTILREELLQQLGGNLLEWDSSRNCQAVPGKKEPFGTPQRTRVKGYPKMEREKASERFQGNRMKVILMTDSPFCAAPTGLAGYCWPPSPR